MRPARRRIPTRTAVGLAGLVLAACSSGPVASRPSPADPTGATPVTQPVHVRPAPPSGWNVVAGTTRRVPVTSAAVRDVGLYGDEQRALGVVASYLAAGYSAEATGLATGAAPPVAWLSGGVVDHQSPVYPALVAGPDQITWPDGIPSAASGANAAFDLRVVAWSGGSGLLSPWAATSITGPWIASFPSPARPAYLDLGTHGALLAAFMPFAVEYGAAITVAGRVVDEHWDVYSYAELRPGRSGALGLYSPLVHALVWSKVVPSLPSAPSYVHSVLAAAPPPAGAVAVNLD